MTKRYEFIETEITEKTGRLILNRPPVNVINIDMMREITACLKEFAIDDSLRLIVIAAKGKFFSAGMDVDDHRPEKVHTMIKEFGELFLTMEKIHTPILAAVQGSVLGGGLEIVSFCDMIVASDKAKFGNPEIKVGFFPPVSAVIFPHLVGHPMTMEIICTGESITAERAYQTGLINRVFLSDNFETETESFINSITQNSGSILRFNKRAVKETEHLPFDKALEKASDIFLNELMKSDDTAEGIKAFFEKRKPLWKDS
ncbi:MAG: hypothetical protein A2161_22005 [Candidatus Schekmanbacteria bacterium RBG_13_48_7]|uniref:Enoyl-CoA hydratase n=1 Tax=Candidatus Schekmanbacteria bacterium RBG_13_48_7 TaxID=1817878 RepID=A0A1F7RVN3_9BACT|nr:MAG: hypothetical protein A2161_22005 [Candidatus Schekmanbacteria bacterium RBG_13_48_7]